MAIEVQALTSEYRDWAYSLICENWGSNVIVTRGKAYQVEELPGFIAVLDGVPQGLITYRIELGECEIVTLDSTVEGKGIGSALVEAVRLAAIGKGCRRIWLVTTNDNTAAFRFYQLRNFELVAVYRNAIAESRKLKPEIPETGAHGIPIRDEIEFELRL